MIDEAALAAGRPPTAIRRAYNLPGVITAPGRSRYQPKQQGVIVGTAAYWVEEMLRYYVDLRMDTLLFAPAGQDTENQMRMFAEEVVPALRLALESTRS